MTPPTFAKFDPRTDPTNRRPLELFHVPLVSLVPVTLEDANALLVRFEHKLGPVNRPFRSEAFAMLVDARPVGVVVSASTVSDRITGEIDGERVDYGRMEVVELARLAAEPWASRVMIRLWREVLAPRWDSWRVYAAVSYSHNAMHKGDLYRFDGWTRIRTDAGSSGGGAWTRKRYATDAVHGSKSLWVWRYGR